MNPSLAPEVQQPAAPRTGKSLRTRWNAAFAVLLLALVVGGVGGIAGTRTLVKSYRHTALDLEARAGLFAQLRADIVPHALGVVSAAPDAASLQERTRLARAIRSAFRSGIAGAHSAEERRLLQAGSDQWAAFLVSIPTLGAGLPAAARAGLVGGAVATEIPKVLTLLDDAGAASRTAARAELSSNAAVEARTYAALLAMVLLAAGLMLRLAHRLSVEVLRPVSALRASANRLAAGDLTDRVDVGRADEIGDLAHSFNAMADAIAGSQHSLTQQANHDSLTGLPNRAGFGLRVQDALSRPDRRDGTQALLFVDLDDFKDVNDLLGHAAGDELLRIVAARLTDVVRPGDLVARLGGDEFALLLDGIPDAEAAYALADRAVVALAEPVTFIGTSVHVGASIGLAMRQPDSDLDGLMREADMAMYSAKGHGKSRVECYDATLHDTLVEHQSLKADVLHAAARDELVLDYQPIIDLDTGALVGMEALVRWEHPARGLLPPSAFIGLAETTGAIESIGAWVLRSACERVGTWQKRYARPDLSVSVNVSMRQLEQPGFVRLVKEVLDVTGLPATTLVLEVTESVLAEPNGFATSALEHLRRLGVRVALDDFGTGYSSISYLRQLPVDVLKIDRSFISGPEAAGGEILLAAIVGLGQRLGLEVIPEGIESVEELRRVQALGCARGQGFLLSRPISPVEIDEWLSAPASVHEFYVPAQRKTWTVAGTPQRRVADVQAGL